VAKGVLDLLTNESKTKDEYAATSMDAVSYLFGVAISCRGSRLWAYIEFLGSR